MLELIEVNSIYSFLKKSSYSFIRAKKYFLKSKDFLGSRENNVRGLEG